MANKFTPGPWVVTGDFIRGTDSGNSPDGYEHIGKVVTEWMDSPVDRKEANAQLIAAAPELLAALELALDVTRTGPDQVIGFDRGGQRQQDFDKGWNAAKDQLWAALESARVVIAKARGE